MERLKSTFNSVFLLGTRKQIRTATPVKAPPPQSGASTNFATRVFMLSRARRETRTLKDITPTASETATFTNFAIRALNGLQIYKISFIELKGITFFQ